MATTVEDINSTNRKQYNKQYYKDNKDKVSARGKKYYEDNKDRISIRRKEYRENNRDKVNARNKRSNENNPHRMWVRATINSHKKKGFIINITIDELTEIAKDIPKCFLCGVGLSWSRGDKNGKAQFNSPSLDRINNENNINKNNIQIICYRCNSAKGTRTTQELIDYCKCVTKINSHKEGDKNGCKGD